MGQSILIHSDPLYTMDPQSPFSIYFRQHGVCHYRLLSGDVGQSVGSKCLGVCAPTITFEGSDLWPRYLARWFNLILPGSNS